MKHDTVNWIPTSERLPEAGQTVLATIKGGLVWCIVFEKGKFTDFRNDFEVLAWQPLPEPYKGDNQEVQK